MTLEIAISILTEVRNGYTDYDRAVIAAAKKCLFDSNLNLEWQQNVEGGWHLVILK